MLRLASITTGVAELPQVLAMAELKVATSVLELPVVAPGAVGSPAQFADVDQVPLAVEPPSHVWLAANTLDVARTKTAVAAKRRIFFMGILGENFPPQNPPPRSQNKSARASNRRTKMLGNEFSSGKILKCCSLNIK